MVDVKGPRPFPCVYRDGKSSRTYEAEVSLYGDFLHIVVREEVWPAEIIRWKISGTQTADVPLADHLELRYGTYPRQTLVIRSNECITAIRASYPKLFMHTGIYDTLLKTKKRIALAALVGISTLVALYFFGVPFLSDIVVSVLPPEQEAYIGKNLFDQITKKYEVSQPLTDSVSSFAEHMVLGGPPPEIRVLLGDEVNAFAVMGGYIGIYEPLLALIESPDELAALLAHEYAHIEKQHSARLIFRALSGYLIVSVLLGDFSGATVTIVQNADMLNTLRYSRKFEAEADAYALEILRWNGMDGSGMANLFNRIHENHDLEGIEWFSSHPEMLTRIELATQSSLTGEYRTAQMNETLEIIFSEIRSLVQKADDE